ncbi:hypothetical protein [Methylobacillus flagellatus]|uniref:hypothetical protein n=1 Tax=Methylobacillus flagellatus TaxID=405 RepID=UPI0010F48E3A|nr:hypothetical protein [Methylobacillus flagellatus]
MNVHNHAFQPTYLPPLRAVKSAAEGERYAPMKASITIDAKSGNVSLGGLLITTYSMTSELSESFSIEPERPVLVLGKSIPCQFAVVQVVDGSQPVRIALRFENGVLVSCFFTFPSAAPDEERRACSQWLTDQLGFSDSLARFPWGSAGVATDRSGSSHVFMHNQNNSWAR